MARFEDLNDAGFRIKYDDAGVPVDLVDSRGASAPFPLIRKTLTGRSEILGAAFRAPDLTYIPFGDSLVANGFNFSGQNSWCNQRGHFHLWNQLQGAPLRCIGSAGVGGETSSQWLLRIQAQVIDKKPGYCLVSYPVNDCRNGVDPDTVTIPNLISIYKQLNAAGIYIIQVDGGDSTQIDLAEDLYCRDTVDKWLRDFCAPNGILLLSARRGTADPATSYGATNMLYDVTHYAGYGATAAAVTMLQDSKPVLDFGPMKRPIARSPYTALQNASLVGNNAAGANGFSHQAGITGTGPDAVATYKTGSPSGVVTSKVARTDGVSGEWARIVGTSTVDGDSLGFIATILLNRTFAFQAAKTLGTRILGTDGNHYVVVTGGTSTGSEPTWDTRIGTLTTDAGGVVYKRVENLLPGDTFEIVSEFAITGVSGGGLGVLPIMLANLGGVTSPAVNGIRVNAWSSPDVTPPWPVSTPCALRSMPVTIGAGCTQIQIYVIARLAGVGVTANLDVGLIDLHKI